MHLGTTLSRLGATYVTSNEGGRLASLDDHLDGAVPSDVPG